MPQFIDCDIKMYVNINFGREKLKQMSEDNLLIKKEYDIHTNFQLSSLPC